MGDILGIQTAPAFFLPVTELLAAAQGAKALIPQQENIGFQFCLAQNQGEEAVMENGEKMKKFNYEQFEEILAEMERDGLISNWQAFGIGHYRVNGKLDIWPRRRKYLYLGSWEHGQYEELASFLALVCG